MKELFSLGDLYVSDFIKDGQTPRGGKVEMKMMLEESTGAVRLEKCAPLNSMFGQYWYRSGVNQTMKKELSHIVESINNSIELKENDVWLDIACNDGTLLSYVPSELIKVGIDPADDTFKAESEKHSDITIQSFFSYEAYKSCKFGKQKPKVITCIAMFYDLDQPAKFLEDVYNILDDDGLFVLQLSYTPLMIKQLAFDNICHEHIYYYSLFNMKNLLSDNGFKIVDCQLNDTNGGSFRVYVMKDVGNTDKFSTQQNRDICEFRIKSFLEYEKTLNLDSKETWDIFFQRVIDLKKETVSFIKSEKEKGKTIWGYGASTKGNTLLQYFNLDSTLIDGIAERSTFKWGLKTVGTNIPIYSEDEMRKAKPDYLLILPWHFINEFKQREKEYLRTGGKFIVPCPKFEIVGVK